MNKEDEKIFTERGFTNIEQMATMFDYYKKELERYKNIVDELEKYLNEVMESYGYETDITDRIEKIAVKNILRKLKELKEE